MLAWERRVNRASSFSLTYCFFGLCLPSIIVFYCAEYFEELFFPIRDEVLFPGWIAVVITCIFLLSKIDQ